MVGGYVANNSLSTMTAVLMADFDFYIIDDTTTKTNIIKGSANFRGWDYIQIFLDRGALI